MKKIYLSLVCLATIGSVFSQTSETKSEKISLAKIQPAVFPKKSTAIAYSTEKSLGENVWSSDFSNSSDWTIATVGGTATQGLGWNIDTIVQSTFFNSNQGTYKIDSKSGKEFAELWNGTGTTQKITYTLTSANPITISTNQLTLSFQQYGQRLNDAQEFFVSTDGSNWTKVGDNSNMDANILFDNPTNMKIKLESKVSSSATKLYIRFSWTSLFPSMTEANAWISYGWMIDDVSVDAYSDNDLKLLNVLPFPGDGFSAVQIPLNQVAPISFVGVIANNGKANQSDANLKVSVTGQSSDYLSTEAELTALTDTFLFSTTSTFLPSAYGTYNFTATAVSSANEDFASDNSLSGSIYITKSAYSTHNGIKTGSISSFSTSTSSFKIGNIMVINKEDMLDSIGITLGDRSTNITQQFFGQVWKYTVVDGLAQPILLAESTAKTITSGNNGTHVKLQLLPPVTVYEGDTLLVLACHNMGTNPVDFAVAQNVLEGTVLGFSDDKLVTLVESGNPFVHAVMNTLYLNKDASIAENKTSSISMSKIYPNPANGTTTASFSLKNQSEVVVSVTDITGKTVYTNDLGNLIAGEHSTVINTESFSNGVYVVKFVTNGVTTTQKLVVRK